MKNELYCGSSCVKYILNEFNIKDDEIKRDMLWASELAIYLKMHGLSVDLYLYNSKLYSDFIGGNFDSSFAGFKYLTEAKNERINIEEKNITVDSLKKDIDESLYIILCVESGIFNNDLNMTGGHYIILKDRADNIVNIINPIKDKYEYKTVDISFLVESCKNYGAWRILIREDKI